MGFVESLVYTNRPTTLKEKNADSKLVPKKSISAKLSKPILKCKYVIADFLLKVFF